MTRGRGRGLGGGEQSPLRAILLRGRGRGRGRGVRTGTTTSSQQIPDGSISKGLEMPAAHDEVSHQASNSDFDLNGTGDIDIDMPDVSSTITQLAESSFPESGEGCSRISAPAATPADHPHPELPALINTPGASPSRNREHSDLVAPVALAPPLPPPTLEDGQAVGGDINPNAPVLIPAESAPLRRSARTRRPKIREEVISLVERERLAREREAQAIQEATSTTGPMASLKEDELEDALSGASTLR